MTGDAFSLCVGDVHLIGLDESNGITPHPGEEMRNKFYIILGFDDNGNVIGGLVINSVVNPRLPSVIRDYHLPVSVRQCPFLRYDSFVNCSKIIVANRGKFSRHSFRGHIGDADLLAQILHAVKESPITSRKMLERFGIS